MVDLGLQESDSKRVSGYIEFNEGIGNANFYLLTKDNETLKIQYPNLKFQNIALEGIEFLIKCTIDPKRVSGYIEFNEGIGNANFYLLTKDNETLKIQYPNLKFQNIAVEGIEFLIKCTIDLSQKVYCTITDITDYHEMTLKEIEKELGYKIKIKEG